MNSGRAGGLTAIIFAVVLGAMTVASTAAQESTNHVKRFAAEAGLLCRIAREAPPELRIRLLAAFQKRVDAEADLDLVTTLHRLDLDIACVHPEIHIVANAAEIASLDARFAGRETDEYRRRRAELKAQLNAGLAQRGGSR